jgi:hypothetical protein
MGNLQSSIKKINYEDIQFAMNNQSSFVLINTLNSHEQDCLIQNTIISEEEEVLINNMIQQCKFNMNIILYGKHINDESIMKKYNQLQSLHFNNVYIYQGGIFEWLLLQDIYGAEEFPTTSKQIDILKFKPNKTLNIQLLEY